MEDNSEVRVQLLLEEIENIRRPMMSRNKHRKYEVRPFIGKNTED